MLVDLTLHQLALDLCFYMNLITNILIFVFQTYFVQEKVFCLHYLT